MSLIGSWDGDVRVDGEGGGLVEAIDQILDGALLCSDGGEGGGGVQ